jgi:hypothetical protein
MLWGFHRSEASFPVEVSRRTGQVGHVGATTSRRDIGIRFSLYLAKYAQFTLQLPYKARLSRYFGVYDDNSWFHILLKKPRNHIVVV